MFSSLTSCLWCLLIHTKYQSEFCFHENTTLYQSCLPKTTVPSTSLRPLEPTARRSPWKRSSPRQALNFRMSISLMGLTKTEIFERRGNADGVQKKVQNQKKQTSRSKPPDIICKKTETLRKILRNPNFIDQSALLSAPPNFEGNQKLRNTLIIILNAPKTDFPSLEQITVLGTCRFICIGYSEFTSCGRRGFRNHEKVLGGCGFGASVLEPSGFSMVFCINSKYQTRHPSFCGADSIPSKLKNALRFGVFLIRIGYLFEMSYTPKEICSIRFSKESLLTYQTNPNQTRLLPGS